MGRRLGRDVSDHEAVIVVVEDIGGYLAAADLAEDALLVHELLSERLGQLHYLDADVVGGLDECYSRAVRDVDRSLHQHCAEAREPLDLGVDVVYVDAEVLDSPVDGGVTRRPYALPCVRSRY